MINLVANELKQAGFKVKTSGQSVKVSLNSRKISTMEVKIALDQIFEEIEFTVQSTSNGVSVQL